MSQYTDREEAMIAILQDVSKQLHSYCEEQNLPDDSYLYRFPIALIEQYLQKIDLEEVDE